MIRRVAICIALSINGIAERAPAQDASWTDVFAPDRLAELAVQYGLQAARGFADVTYEDLSIDILAQRGRLSGLSIYPFPDWENSKECRIEVAEIEIIGSPLVTIDEVALSLRVRNVDAPLVCLPVEMRVPVMATGLDRIAIDSIQIAIDYHVPTASLQMAVNTLIPDLASAQAELDFDYVAYWIRDNEFPVLYLRSGTVTVEDQGAWASVRNLLPPRLLSPESGGVEMARLTRDTFEEAPAIAAGDPDLGHFIASVEDAWEIFLRGGGALSVTIGGPKDSSTFLDLEELVDGQANPFRLLAPRLMAGTARFSTPFDAAALDAAAQGALTEEAAFDVAMALDNGQGLPRNRVRALEILEKLSADGHLPSKTALAMRLAEEDGARAYDLALQAAALGDEDAVRVLDNLEGALPARIILNGQGSTDINGLRSLASRRDAALFRDNARGALSGDGVRRSYHDALVWGLLGQAMNDLESARVVRDVEARLEALGGAEVRTLVAVAEDRALRFWYDVSP